MSPDSQRVSSVELMNLETKSVQVIEDVDAVVMAVGAKGLKSLMAQSPELSKAAPELAGGASLGSIDVVSARLWLDRSIPIAYPVNVFSRFESLKGSGGHFFHAGSAAQGCSTGSMGLWAAPGLSCRQRLLQRIDYCSDE